MVVAQYILNSALPVYVYWAHQRGKANSHRWSRFIDERRYSYSGDVRATADFQAGHIHGAINIPHTKTATRISELEKHRDKLIVLVDQMGQHAGSTGKMLTKDNYNVRRLSGGMSEWQQQNMPVVQGQKS